MKWWAALYLAAILVYPFQMEECPGHEVPEEGAIREEAVGSTGLHLFFFDSDGDGQEDRALLYRRDSAGQLEMWPWLYFEGVDAKTGLAEEVWIDRGEGGHCQDIVLYYKRHVRLR